MGMDRRTAMKAPAMPAKRPATAPSPGVIGIAWFCCRTYAAATPPLTTHKQQHTFAAPINGSADRTPITRPPTSAGWRKRVMDAVSIVVFASKMGDELLTLQIPQRV